VSKRGRLIFVMAQSPECSSPYTHVSDQYAPFQTKVTIVTVRDATNVLDGLLYHESDLESRNSCI
jgi:TnpA family transposase